MLSAIARKIRQSGRFRESSIELFQALDSSATGALSLSDINLDTFSGFGIRLRKKETDKIRKQLGVSS